MCDDNVIRFISQNTIPVAQNLYLIREQKDAAGDFFRGVQKQRPRQYQGLYLVAPDGKVLASHQDPKSSKTWTPDLLSDLAPGLRAFGPIEPRAATRRDPSPFRGRGVRPDGSATAAVYLRYAMRGVPLRELPNPTMDSLTLSPKQLSELSPDSAEAGARWEVPADLARQFSRLLGPGDESTMPRPNEVTAASITGTITRIDGGVANLTYRGALAGTHLNQAKKRTSSEIRLSGVGRYDVKAGRLLSFVLVSNGIYRGPPPYDQPAAFSGVVEWRRE